MIGRFVEQKQVGLHHEQPRKMSAHDPSAAQGARRAIEISFAKSESGQDAFGFRFELLAAVLIKNMERIMISRVISLLLMIMIVLVIGDHVLRVDKFWRHGESQFEHGLIAGSGGFLRKKSDGRVLLDRDCSVIGRNLATDQREQS